MRGNALLLEVTGPGAVDAYADAAEGSAVWAGRLMCYLDERNRQVVSGGQTTNVETTVLHVFGGRALPAITPGEAPAANTVLVMDRRGRRPLARRFQVIGVERQGAGSSVDSVRLELGKELSA